MLLDHGHHSPAQHATRQLRRMTHVLARLSARAGNRRWATPEPRAKSFQPRASPRSPLKVPCGTSSLPAHTRCRDMQDHRFHQHLISPSLVRQHEHDGPLLMTPRPSQRCHHLAGRTMNDEQTLSLPCPSPAPAFIFCASSVSSAAEVGSSFQRPYHGMSSRQAATRCCCLRHVVLDVTHAQASLLSSITPPLHGCIWNLATGPKSTTTTLLPPKWNLPMNYSRAASDEVAPRLACFSDVWKACRRFAREPCL